MKHQGSKIFLGRIRREHKEKIAFLVPKQPTRTRNYGPLPCSLKGGFPGMSLQDTRKLQKMTREKKEDRSCIIETT